MNYIDIAIKAAKEAGQEILKIYNQEYEIKFKENEPLTEADLISNEIIIKNLEKTNIPILSEESENHEFSNFFWVIDPIDGTHDFINKTDEFSILIGLIKDGIPILGVVYQPVGDIIHYAEKGKGSFMIKNNEKTEIKISNNKDITKFKILVSRHHLREEDKEFINQLKITNYVKKGSAGLKISDIANGSVELYFSSTNKIKIWDTCAAHCILEEAGGKITNMDGNNLSYEKGIAHTKGILASNGLKHNEIVQQYNIFTDNFKK
tara:strand:+ start:855 stop:1646 length:792 start_codon:yes stop_codon:yes gene_type:complete